MKNSITFSEDGTSFVINFASGSESLDICSKEEGIKAIDQLVKEEKLTSEDRVDMRNQILEAENLPWSADRKSRRSFSDFMGNNLFFEIALLGSLLSLGDRYAEPDEPVEEAYLKICPKCNNHGRIYVKNGFTSDLGSKAHAMEALNKLKDINEVSAEEFEKVKKQIEESSLPE
jgi:hypothetical protein